MVLYLSSPLTIISRYLLQLFFFLMHKVSMYSPSPSATTLLKSHLPALADRPVIQHPLASFGSSTMRASPLRTASRAEYALSSELPSFDTVIFSISGALDGMGTLWQKSYLKYSTPHSAKVSASTASLPRLAGRSSQVRVPFEVYMPSFAPRAFTRSTSAFMPLGNLTKSPCSLPSASRIEDCQQSSIFI